MLISVTQGGKGIFHFTGDLDAYNLELLRDYAARFEKAPGAELKIKVEEYEETAFRAQAKEWLGTLARTGLSVRVERIRSGVAEKRSTAVAAPEKRPVSVAALTVRLQGENDATRGPR